MECYSKEHYVLMDLDSVGFSYISYYFCCTFVPHGDCFYYLRSFVLLLFIYIEMLTKFTSWYLTFTIILLVSTCHLHIWIC